MRRRSLLAVVALATVGTVVVVGVRQRARESDAASERLAHALAGMEDQLARLNGRQAAVEARLGGLSVAAQGAADGQRHPSAGAVPAATDGNETTPAREKRPRSAEARAAESQGHLIIGEAERAGQWTDADRDKIRGVFTTLDDEGRIALLRELSVAVNDGRLRLAVHGPQLF